LPGEGWVPLAGLTGNFKGEFFSSSWFDACSPKVLKLDESTIYVVLII